MLVTLLTVGEYPALNGLHASQVLPFAVYLQSKGMRVHWVAFVPLEMRLKDHVAFSGSILSNMKKAAKQQGVEINIKHFPITIVRPYSYLLRPWLVRFAGLNLTRLMKKWLDDEETLIIHCRSYFAAAVALEVKNKYHNVRISFDMRSLLPPEIPLMFPHVGPYFYGGLKRWEADLLNRVDYSFLPSNRGIGLLEHEGISSLPTYIPISGFDKVQNSEQTPNIYDNPVIGYFGGFGPWHSASLLDHVFAELAKNIPGCSFEVLSSTPVTFKSLVNVHSLPHHEVRRAVGAMLAIVVPGTRCTNDNYMAIVRTYLFSTKAAEALSLGVPIIVNENIRELADYVRTRKCGIVFSIMNGRPCFNGPDKEKLGSNEFWIKLRIAARECAPEFMRANVFEKYMNAWSSDKRKNYADG